MSELNLIDFAAGLSDRTNDDFDQEEYLQSQCDRMNREEGSLNEKDGYNCDICKNKGVVYVVKNDKCGAYEAMQICKCAKVRKAIRELKRSGLETVARDYTFDKFIATEDWQIEALQTCKAFIVQQAKEEDNYRNRCLFLGGTSGCGKTHLGTATAIYLLKQGKGVKYMLWRDDVAKIKSVANTPEYSAMLQEYKDVDVLYIDDLFKTGKRKGDKKQMPTQADINIAYEIISKRYTQKKITIISSECCLSEIIEIDEALGGRIRYDCGQYAVNIAADKTKNYRLKER